jgi:hypothetical protein
MAQITIASHEIKDTLDLMESMFKGLDLSPIKNIFEGTDITGNVNISKKLKTETFTLNVNITK